MRNSDSSPSFRREQLRRVDPIPAINVTPYPLSTSTEMTMAMSAEAQALQVNNNLFFWFFSFFSILMLNV